MACGAARRRQVKNGESFHAHTLSIHTHIIYTHTHTNVYRLVLMLAIYVAYTFALYSYNLYAHSQHTRMIYCDNIERKCAAMSYMEINLFLTGKFILQYVDCHRSDNDDDTGRHRETNRGRKKNI